MLNPGLYSYVVGIFVSDNCSGLDNSLLSFGTGIATPALMRMIDQYPVWYLGLPAISSNVVYVDNYPAPKDTVQATGSFFNPYDSIAVASARVVPQGVKTLVISITPGSYRGGIKMAPGTDVVLFMGAGNVYLEP